LSIGVLAALERYIVRRVTNKPCKISNKPCKILVGEIESKSGTCVANFSLLGVLGMTGTDKVRVKQRIQIKKFPFNICNATTCHKLQGATKECLVVNSFRYTDNWPYVVLSRVTKQKGLFLRVPLDGYKVNGMSDKLCDFLEHWIETKSPIPPQDNDYDRDYTT
jgi:hypothetical protein